MLPTASQSVRQRAALYGVLFMMGADMFLVPMLVPAIAAALASSISHTAFIVTAFGIAYAGSCPLLAGLAHSWPTRTVIGVGLSIVVIACTAAIFANTIAMLIAARTASGLGAAIVNPAIWSRLHTTAAGHARGRVMLGGTAVSAAGQVVGIPLGTLVAANSGWRMAFGTLAVGFAAAWIGTRITMSPDGGFAESQSQRAGVIRPLRLWRSPAFSLAIVANIAAQAARLGVYSYVAALLLRRYTLHGADLGIIGIVAGAGSLVGALLGTATVSRWCRHGWPVLGLSAVATAVLAAGIVLTTAPISLELNLIGLAVSFAAGIAIFGTSQFHVASTFHGDRTAISWNSSAMYIGAAIGTFTLGFMSPGSTAFMVVGLLFASVGAGCCLVAIAIGDRALRSLARLADPFH
jgi:predicted MFS family arabinose efflux permease